MRFVKKAADVNPVIDTVFEVADAANQAKALHGPEAVTNATIGVLCDESGKLVAFDSVFESYNKIDNLRKATYAQSFRGNPDFCSRVYDWVTEGVSLELAHSVVATVGGTGAIAMTFADMLDVGETVILPDIAWDPYTLMAKDNQLNIRKYALINEHNEFNLDSFKQTCLEVLREQKKLLIVINDPCHNPTGYSMTEAEWTAVIEFINECSQQGPCIILNDIAYIDFGYEGFKSRQYLKTFENITENVLVVIAFSTSKSLTSYGLRCGAAVALAKNEEDARHVEVIFEKSARSRWSNVPNAAMGNFVSVTTNHLDVFLQEKERYVRLIKDRSGIFLDEARNVGLHCYPYKEGFFITIRMENNAIRDTFHKALQDELIFTVIVEKGIRLAICSLPLKKCLGLAGRMKRIFDSLN